MTSTSTLTIAGALISGVLFVRSANMPLRVCADAGNLPYSDKQGAGFENEIARVIAAGLDRRMQFVWQDQPGGFREARFRSGHCDVEMAVLPGTPGVATTRAYYRSTYVFVRRGGAGDLVTSVADPRLAKWRVGLFAGGQGDYSDAPPAEALALIQPGAKTRAFSFHPKDPDSPSRAMVDAVARGEIDVAALWGPAAGYFAADQQVPLDITPMTMPASGPAIPLAFDVAVGVRPNDAPLRVAIDAVLATHATEINEILARFHVPQVTARD